MERTFIMITPDGTARGKVGAIVERLEDKGFKLVSLKLLTPSLELARAHFSGAAVKPYFEGLVENMCAGPVVAMCWEGTGVIAQGYAMLGALDPADALPGTVRGDGCVQSGRQLCHGSANATAANQELNLWFTQEELCLYEGASNSWVYESCEKKDGKEAASLVAADVRATGPNKADIKKNEPAQTSAALDDLMSLPATELFALLGSPLVDKARTVEAMTALKARLRDPAFVSPSMDVEDILARTRRGGADEWTLLDARSPSEYATGRIPGAQSLPLFDDAERARVGTDFKHDGPQEAMFVGMCIVAPKLPALVERARMLAGPGGRVAVHCWRGGMRSRSLAWLLRLHGLEVVVLEGGYKAFRAWVRVSWGGLTMAPASAPAGPKKQEKRSYSKVRTILPGLTLFPGVLEPTTHDSVVQELQTLLERGRKGDLGGHTYTPVPMKFEARKQSREMLQFGAYTHSNRVESAMVEPLPPPLILVIDKLIVAGVFRPHERPDCCTVNFYKPGNWLPPHIDSKKFARPFASVSLLSAQVVEVGQVCEKQEDFKCVQRVEMPVSSCIRFHGPAADEMMHAIPPVSESRISLTFRRLRDEVRQEFEVPRRAKDLIKQRLGQGGGGYDAIGAARKEEGRASAEGSLAGSPIVRPAKSDKKRLNKEKRKDGKAMYKEQLKEIQQEAAEAAAEACVVRQAAEDEEETIAAVGESAKLTKADKKRLNKEKKKLGKALHKEQAKVERADAALVAGASDQMKAGPDPLAAAALSEVVAAAQALVPRLCVVGGRTGVGKTRVLIALREQFGQKVLDLEGEANHRGSTFGWCGQPEKQPTTEQYANTLAVQWREMTATKGWIFIEDEDNHVGSCGVPEGLYAMMRCAPLVVRVVVPQEERVRLLCEDYSSPDIVGSDTEAWLQRMADSVRRLEKRLGAKRRDEILGSLMSGDYDGVARALLQYYDVLYDRHLVNGTGTGGGAGKRPGAVYDVHSGDAFSAEEVARGVLEQVRLFEADGAISGEGPSAGSGKGGSGSQEVRHVRFAPTPSVSSASVDSPAVPIESAFVSSAPLVLAIGLGFLAACTLGLRHLRIRRP